MHVLATVTLNPNQLRAHLEPIADLPEVSAITLVADVDGLALPRLVTVVPPRRLVRLTGRAFAKLLCAAKRARQERPAWVIGYNLVPHGITAVVVARLTGARSMVHLIGGTVEWSGGGHASDNALLKRLRRPVPALERALVWVLSRADVVAVMGAGARADLVAHGLPAARLAVLPASVDDRRFSPAPADHARRYDVVTVAALIPLKRLHDVLDAAARLLPERPDLRVAIAGRGPLDAALREHARRLGVAHAVDFLGYVPDVERLYADSRVFVLASRTEGLSIALCEAMASGLPAVVSDVGEARELIEPEETGFLFDVGDVGALTAHLSRLLSHAELRTRVGLAARRTAVARVGRAQVSQRSRAVLSGQDKRAVR